MKKIACLPIILTLLAGPAGCKKEEAAAKVSSERSINVVAKPVSKKKFRPYIEAVGTLKPSEEVVISAEAGGILKELRVDAGSPVEAGMTLALIEDADYRLEVKRAEAALMQAEAALTSTKTEFGRKEVLYKEALITEQQLEDVSTRLSLAEAQTSSAESALSLARLRLEKTNIKSPIGGFVRERTATAGDLIKAGSPIMSVIRVNPLKLAFSVPEKDIGPLRPGLEIVFTVDSFQGKEFRARVSRLYPALEEKTRTLQVEAEAPNGTGALRPGLFARLTLYTGGAKEMLVVPRTAVLHEGERTKLFVAEGDVARELFVKAGQKYETVGGEFVEIREGVKEGDVVVTVGQQNLFEGAKIKASSD